MNGIIKVQVLLDFLSEAYRSNFVSREFPAERLSLRCRVKQFPSLKGGHHRGYSNCGDGWRTERAVLHPLLRRLAEANSLFTELSLNFVVTRTTFPQHGSHTRLGFGQSDRNDLERNNINVFHFMKFGFVCVELSYLGASRLSAQYVLSFVFCVCGFLKLRQTLFKG
ncbi:hypothetical protein AMECASPLE_038251 [Ameca splendens]|uniref:Uncharacterized protein n=1 Tax=Ameca splendens TaxID=208324 RepID=A0ABV1A5N3_9TELE